MSSRHRLSFDDVTGAQAHDKFASSVALSSGGLAEQGLFTETLLRPASLNLSKQEAEPPSDATATRLKAPER